MQDDGHGAVPLTTVTEATWGEYGRRLRFLRHIGLFQHAPQEVLTPVATALKPVSVPASALICREGEPGDQLFLIESGTLVVLTEVGEKPYELARLGPGEFFGEMALLRQGRRTATVRAETAAKLWSLSYADFQELLARDPAINDVIRRAMQLREKATTEVVFEVEHRNLAALAEGKQQIRVGRDRDNDLVLSSRLVSRHHAVVEWSGEAYHLRDLGSNNGTYVNGSEVRHAILRDGDEIWIANERIVFDRRRIQRLTEPHGVRVDVTNVSKAVKGGKTLLHDITLSILPGEFVAIVGGSGAGKTTLMDAISGVRPATSGRVLYNGRDYYRNIALYRNVIGYVPQDDIIHTSLPLRVTLRHSAKLRLPTDTRAADLDAAVDEAIQTLGLTAQANTRVKDLSGGQRKRSSIGGELLTGPRIFFLDEPTSGLDPATDAQMMRLMRQLADKGASVILTTHATKNVVLCDKIIFLARGGHLAFVGTPQRALQYFGAETFDEIYDQLANEATPEEWSQRFRASADYAQVLADQPRVDQIATPGKEVRGAGVRTGGALQQVRQFAVLSKRDRDLYLQNPPNVIPLFMQPVVFALALLAIFHAGAFNSDAENPNAALQLLFLLSFNSFLFGLLFGIQSIVKEFPIFYRERRVNLGIVPYVLSKLVFLVPVLMIGQVIMVGTQRLFGRLPAEGFGTYGQILLTLWLTTVAGLTMSLMLSASVSTVEQSSQLLPLPIMPQVLFSGAILAVPSVGIVAQLISNVIVARWSFEALGRITMLNDRFRTNTSPAGGPIGQALFLQYGTSFTRAVVQNWLILALFIVVPLIVTCLILKRKSVAT
jgi:ABC-type multidrug transport system ATPase subunit/CRP-like cAMP-binding protein